MRTFWTVAGAEPEMAVHPAAIAWTARIVSILNTAASRQDILGIRHREPAGLRAGDGSGYRRNCGHPFRKCAIPRKECAASNKRCDTSGSQRGIAGKQCDVSCLSRDTASQPRRKAGLRQSEAGLKCANTGLLNPGADMKHGVAGLFGHGADMQRVNTGLFDAEAGKQCGISSQIDGVTGLKRLGTGKPWDGKQRHIPYEQGSQFPLTDM